MFSLTVPLNRKGFLRHDTYLARQRVKSQVPDIISIDRNHSPFHVIET